MIRAFLAALLIGLVFGFGGGYHYKGERVEAEKARQVAQLRKEEARAIADSQATNRAITSGVEQNAQDAAKAKKEIKRYVAPKKRVARSVAKSESSPPVPHEVVGEGLKSTGTGFADDDYLPVGVVWVLNRTYDGTIAGATGPSDAEGSAPSTVTRDAFLEHHIGIAEQYKDLAKRHDALVGWAEKAVKQQRDWLKSTGFQ